MRLTLCLLVSTFLVLTSALEHQNVQKRENHKQAEEEYNVITNVKFIRHATRIDVTWELLNPSPDIFLVNLVYTTPGSSQNGCNSYYPSNTTVGSESCDDFIGNYFPLEPCTLYDIKITAENENYEYIGQSVYEQEYTTPESAPSAGFTCSVNTTSDDEIQINSDWNSPQRECVKYQINWSYQILWDEDTLAPTYSDDVKNTTYHEIADAIPYTEYNLRLSYDEDFLADDEKCSVITPQQAPSEPRNVAVYTTDAHSLSVNWDAPLEMNGLLEFYTVNWTSVDTHGSIKVTDNNVHVIKLTSCQEYLFSVSATTGGGSSDTVFGNSQTTGVEVSPAVMNVSSPVINADSVLLSWIRPDTLCDISQYVISYNGSLLWGESAMDVGEVQADGELTQIYVTGLVGYTQYEFCITPQNDAGTGPETCIAGITTLEGEPTPPLNVEASRYNAYSIDVSWDPPAYMNGILDHYTVYWSPPDGAGSLVLEKTFTIVSGLHPCTNYTVNVTATTGSTGNGGETSAPSEPSVGQSGDISPPKVEMEIFLSEQVVHYTWEEPEMDYCEVTSYELLWSEKILWTDEYTTHTVVLPSTTFSYEINNTVPYSTYGGNFKAKVNKFYGPTDYVDPVQTDEMPASPPTSLESILTTDTSVRYEWREPEALNGLVTHYSLSLTTLEEVLDVVNVTYGVREYEYDLSQCANYIFYISAVNGAGLGESSSVRTSTFGCL